MSSLFSVEYNPSVAIDVLRDIRQKVAAIRGPIFDAANGPIKEAVAEIVDNKIAPAPGPSQHPFLFATANSRAWYFANMRNGITGQEWNKDGGEWARQGTLENAWTVSVNTSANDTFMEIENSATDYKGDSYPQAVYGPDPVPGFAETGWGDNFDDTLDEIADLVEDMLLDALDQALGAYQS